MNWLKQNYNLKLISLLAIVVYGAAFALSIYINQTEDKLLIHDVSRLFPDRVYEIVEGEEEAALVEAVKAAKENNLKISIGGARHSQGGHAFYQDSVFLDMSNYNKILKLDEKEKTIKVQSGVTWEQIQDYINPHGLAIKVMQSSNVFTVGGSLSSNVHGRDPQYGPLIETVKSFRLLKADGNVINVSRNENEELFELVIGGYGLFGVILDVTLELTDNEIYVSQTEKINYKDYPEYIIKQIANNDDVGLHFARLAATPDDLLNDMYMTTYRTIDKGDDRYPTNEDDYEELVELNEEQNVLRDKFFFGLSRKYDWAKNLVWDLQQKLYAEKEEGEVVSRNNAMRPPIEFLEYDSDKDTDILQEYFIPVDHFEEFVDGLRKIVKEDDLNLMNVTVRYTPKHNEGYLTYAKEDTLALVLLFNHELSDEGIAHMKLSTQKIVNQALELNGRYYLTYQLFPSQDQIRKAYPKIESFFKRKLEYDPNERFMNNFYERYAK
ncbi:FAD-binding oxidoreductase [Filobacillus milosensis]|uniref:FAD-binding oxidoreductase n=1 Tax=Filobacillus milosensis TaxID=94137 RepID=A0A4Y8IV36_9BACI|nr:FAD-binding oxidoreductase [Filobacillus milosensis]TFB24049.1 FAD-binding oxidoreductase [Filobacillus milosensis]